MHPVSKGRIVAVPNVTPMIDVMLVLLIIFMVVTPTLLNGVHAEPPVADHAKAHPEDEGDHTLALDKFGRLFLDKEPIPVERLGPALQALYPPESSNRVLYIRAHKELAYAHVADAIEVARSSGVAVVGLVSEQRIEHAPAGRGRTATPAAGGRGR